MILKEIKNCSIKNIYAIENEEDFKLINKLIFPGDFVIINNFEG